MADTASTGGRLLAPTGYSPELSRRQMFAGTGLVLGAAALATASPATALAHADRAARAVWDRAMSRLASAERAASTFDEQVYDPRLAELQKIAPRPRLSFDIHTTKGGKITHAFSPFRLDEWDDHVSPLFRREAGKVKAAWLRHFAAKDQLGLDAVAKESERLQDEVNELEGQVMCLPAPDRGALLWKLERLFGDTSGRRADESGGSFDAEWMNAVMLDARNFLSA